MEFVGLGRFLLSFMVVLGLIGLLAVLTRKFGARGMLVRPKEEARLEVLESLPLDARARLILIRRDGVQHLLVRTPESIRVIEGGFSAPDMATPTPQTKGSEDDSDA